MERIKKKPGELLQDRIFTISNFLSISRVLLLPFFVYYTYHYKNQPGNYRNLVISLLICGLAVLTDYFDGYFARLLNQETVLGRYLDPICDKIVTIGGLIVLVRFFYFPLWILLIYIIREILGVWLGAYLYLKRGIQGKPNWWGKIGVGLVSVAMFWYLLLPLFQEKIQGQSILKNPEITGYFLIFVLFIGIYAYSKRYWTIVFYPEKYEIQEELKEKKKYHVV
ncbi:MAG: CDP-alcohol phosphatidyltransferase family protein [Leptospiraceae bacterium]|nr:CDP-alcohol phosphatidyltransferase family protein [Leptospiraceae bacterium]MCK6379648.1 CDP-alcohol phosphatidyltransferase family protein [Leptospiraceae bacterium]